MPTSEPTQLFSSERLGEELVALQRALQHEKQRRIEADGLLEGLRALNGAQNTQQVFEKLVEVLRRFILFDEAIMLQINSQKQLNSICASSEDFLGLTWKVSDVFQRVLDGQTVAVFDTNGMPDWLSQPDTLSARVRSAIYVSLHTGISEAMLVFVHAKPAFFNKTHLHLLERFIPLTNQALASIEYREMLEKAELVRLRAEQNVQNLLLEQNLVLENAGVGIAFLKDRRIVRCNQEFATMFGYQVESLIGTSTLALHTSKEEYKCRERSAYDAIGRGAAFSSDAQYRRCDGTLFWATTTLTAIDRTDPTKGVICVTHDIDQRKRVEQALLESESQIRAVFNTALDAIVAMDVQGLIVDWNSMAETVFGWSKSEVMGRYLDETIMPTRYRAAYRKGLARFLTSSEARIANHRIEISAIRRNGDEFPIELSVTSVNVGNSLRFTAFISDVSVRKKAEADLRIAATAFESQEGMMITDANGVILRVNRAFTESTGYTAEEAVGQTPRLLKSGRHNAAFFSTLWESIRQTGSWQGEIWDRRKNGEIYPKWLTITAVKSDAGDVTHYVGTHIDITARKTAEEQITHLAFYDPLTQLPNRRLLLDRLQQALAAGSRSTHYGALLFIDLDHFKTLNDTLGHDKGDLLLQQVAQRLVACVRDGDTVARLGGDEFVVLLEGLSKFSEEAAPQAESVGDKILTILNRPYLLAGYENRSTPSIGITLFGGHQTSYEDLLKQADLAMYQAKAAGRNTLRFFDPEMQALVSSRAALEVELRGAVNSHQLALYYQPQVDGEGCLTGAEALVRWLHPARGLVSPAEFIPLAEETGLILPLGQWVLRTACAQLAQWSVKPETALLSLAVNVSAKQLQQSDFVEQVLDALNLTGANPRRLKLELTESLMVSNVENTIKKMTALKAWGVGFSLDDFGTGYSSLSYLKRLPLDQLKIDQSFVRDILVDSNDTAIAKMIVALAESLGLSVIAEGVEIEKQRVMLEELGCRAYQGYLFSRPLALDDFEEYAQNQHVVCCIDRLNPPW
ncbi:EAL domain-containing protein [Rhodoferax sp. GW822-FHT02A01]|uniref:sensor domain-containing protein n=1 Tax=Rhodoferax sp. GW822-FHT02A01 TaxID=3141537 RepID=UPI00315C917C